MKPKLLKLLEQCIESGVMIGYTRAHKYNDKPDKDAITLAIIRAIEHELYEWFDFDDAYPEEPLRYGKITSLPT